MKICRTVAGYNFTLIDSFHVTDLVWYGINSFGFLINRGEVLEVSEFVQRIREYSVDPKTEEVCNALLSA